MARPKLVLLLVSIAALTAPGEADAATLVPIGEFDSPMHVTSHPHDPSRLYVVEREGRVKQVTPAGASDVLDISDRVTTSGERGLLSIALAPDFASSGLLYAFYTDNGGDLQIDEYRVAGGVADPASRRPLLTIEHSMFSNHNGGQLQFGPDGFLYASTGDGGSSGDPGENAQDLTELLGKLLRIGPASSATGPYSIPSDNPFAGTGGDPVPGAGDEIWSYGLRNPWRFSFDHLTGALAIGDVGQDAWEEIDYVPGPQAGRGLNFGWDCREGRHDFEPLGCPPPSAFTEPVFEYANSGSNCAITGGYVVRDVSLGDLYGRYLFADLCGGVLRSIVPAVPLASGARSEGLAVPSPVSFGEDAACGLYVVSLSGPVYRIAGDAPSSCPAGATPPPGIEMAATKLVLEAKRKRIARGNRARLKVRASPCPGRAGDRVKLRRGGKRIRAKRLNERCRARFKVRIRKPRRFRAFIAADEAHLRDRSNRVRVRIRRR